MRGFFLVFNPIMCWLISRLLEIKTQDIVNGNTSSSSHGWRDRGRLSATRSRPPRFASSESTRFADSEASCASVKTPRSSSPPLLRHGNRRRHKKYYSLDLSTINSMSKKLRCGMVG